MVTEKHERRDVRQTPAKTKKHAHAVLEGPGGVQKHTNRFLEIRQEPQRLGQCRQCAATPLPRSPRRQYQQVAESAGTLRRRRHNIPVAGIICPLCAHVRESDEKTWPRDEPGKGEWKKMTEWGEYRGGLKGSREIDVFIVSLFYSKLVI